jgi:hypothetical protein
MGYAIVNFIEAYPQIVAAGAMFGTAAIIAYLGIRYDRKQNKINRNIFNRQ